MTAIATFVFEGRPSVALPRMADVLKPHLRAEGLRVDDVSLNGLRMVAPGLALSLSMAHRAEETVVTLALDLGEADASARMAELAYRFARAFEVTSVIWQNTKTAIPRAAFLAGLDTAFAPVPVAPRRIVARRAVTMRPSQVRDTDRRYDAHVAAFEAHMRDAFLRGATPGEIAGERSRMHGQVSAAAGTVMENPALRVAFLIVTVTTLVVSGGFSGMI